LMSLIVQKEVAQRICGKSPKANILATAVQFYAAPKIIAYVSKGSFWPAPKVDAAILQLVPYIKKGERADKQFIAKFFKIVKAGFLHPRKQLAGNLAQELKISREKVESLITEQKLNPKCRAQNLSVENWITLARAFEL